MFIFSNDTKEKLSESIKPEYKGVLGEMLRLLIGDVDAKAMPAIEDAVSRAYPLVENTLTQEAPQYQHIAEPAVTDPTVLKLVSSTPEGGNANYPAREKKAVPQNLEQETKSVSSGSALNPTQHGATSSQELDPAAVRRSVEDAYGEAA